ncbi:Spermidine N(1)-acetyltransferase [Porphyromonas levii]|uniref:GNAT family N-acetyltransferase n=1 Tax=Porphyromonas levii TaxID=28114 RepID=UPI001B8A91CE|nr:GNAT family protein [Porphyromonas levii]MBR8729419.1 Spermidine N(1)-acetyltransferase [Porphyromonas levii]MBR8784443.1 Spermidine N(1)-acetyltransferase [Porphyromonas levii]
MKTLSIRKLKASDLAIRVELLNTPSIQKYLNISETFSLEKTEVWFSKINIDNQRYDCVFLLEDELIGMGGLSHISYKDGSAEFYIYLREQYHGQGLGTKSTKMLLDYGFNELGLRRIYLYTFEENKPANSLYEKVGFQLEGTLREHTFKNNEYHNRRIYGLLKNEYTER